MLTAAVYARYSTGLQRPSSIDDQVSLCRAAAEKFSCRVAEEHIYHDAEMSGTVSQRSGYERLMAAAKAHQFQAVIIEAQDRLWRDQAEMHSALKRLRYWGIKVFSVATAADITDETGSLVATITGLKDSLFVDDLRKKIRRGMVGRVAQGYSVGGRAYGYRSAPTYDERRYDAYGNPMVVGYRKVVNEAEAEVVYRIFHLYASGMSPRAIAFLLNSERVPPPRLASGRHLRGWTWQTIAGVRSKAHGILRNPLYIGRLTWNRTQKVRDPETGRRVVRLRPPDEWVTADVPELRIVSDELWEAVQERSRRQGAWPGNKLGRHQKYILSGLLKCECGANYVIKKGERGRKYYGCGAHFDRGPEICNNPRLVSRDRIERVVLDAIFTEVFSPDTLRYLNCKVNDAIAAMSAPAGDVRKKRHAELAEAHRRLDNIKAAIADGIRTPSTAQMLQEAERRVADLEAVLRSPAGRRKVVYLPNVVEACLRDLKGSLETDPDAARDMLATLIGRVQLRRQGDRLVAEMRGNLPGILGVDEQFVSVVPEEGLEPPRA